MENCKIINFYMRKGGVGKTTVTGMVAFELAKFGKTLIIDSDEQGNLTKLYSDIDNPVLEKQFQDVINQNCKLEEAIKEVRKPKDDFQGLYLLGTNPSDRPRLKSILQTETKANPEIFIELLENAKKMGFNYILTDLPPSYDDPEKFILSKSDMIVPIINCDEFSISSLEEFHKTVRSLKILYNSDVKLSKTLVVNKYDKNVSIQRQYLEIIESSAYNVVVLNKSAAIESSVGSHITIQEYNPTNSINEKIRELAEKLK